MKTLRKLFVFLLVITFFFSYSFLTTFSQNFKSYTIGYGPLEGEVGYPIIVEKDSTGKIVILDALKSAIIIMDNNNRFLNSFSISNSIPPNLTNVSLKISLDSFICILINNTIVKYNFDGTLIQTYSTRDNRFILGKSIQLFAPISGDTFVFKDELTGETFICSFTQESEPIKLINNSIALAGVIDVSVYKDTICLLTSDSNTSETDSSSLFLFSLSGEFLKVINLVDEKEIDYPIACSFDLRGNIYVLSANMTFVIYTKELVMTDKIKIPTITMEDFSKSFSAYQDKSILVCHLIKGVLLLNNSGISSVICPIVKQDRKLFAPTSVCGNRENLFIYDSLTRMISFYQFDIFKKNFAVNELLVTNNFQTKISLFQSNSSSIYIVYQGQEIKIHKLDPSTGLSKEIKIPSYISPRCSVYVRSKDNQIYIYSWFDSILYVLSENSDLPVKIQINKVESAMYSSDCICKIDNNDSIFILLPNLKKMNVFSSSGSLITGFNLVAEGFSYFTSFDFYEDLLVTLNQYNSQLDFYSKRGEILYSTGKKGYILYPKNEKGYMEYSDLLAYPSHLSCINSKIVIADTGNSRVVLFEGTKLTDKIIIELQLGSKSAYINQKRIDLDVAPFTENGRTLVPFRFIGEALGAKVTWFQESKKAIYELSGIIVEITIGSKIALVDKKQITLDVAPQITSGRTFVPIRFVSEALGASVIWEASTKKIIITYPGN